MSPTLEILEDTILDIVVTADQPIGVGKIERIVAGRFPDGDTNTFDVARCVRAMVDAGKITRDGMFRLMAVDENHPPRPHLYWY